MVKIYSNPKIFWNTVCPHLMYDQTINGLLLGRSILFQTDLYNCLFQAALFEGEKFISAVVGSRYQTDKNLIVAPLKKAEHAKLLFDAAQGSGHAFTGVIGDLQTANLYRAWFEGAGKKTETMMAQGLYRCTKTILPKIPTDIKFRVAAPNDREKVAEWIKAFHEEAVPHDPPVNGLEVADTRIAANMIYVIEKDGELLSMAAWSRDIGTSCAVNLVYTPKDKREKGYASIVTGLLTQNLLENGKQETCLFTDMANPTSNRIYQKIGYEFVCDSVHIGITEA